MDRALDDKKLKKSMKQSSLTEITEDQLKEYIAKKEFHMYLQPQYSVSGHTVVGAEALVRWIHEGEFISPGAFIPTLESRGLVTLVDLFIWESAFEWQAERKQAGLHRVPISVNVSREDFSKVDIYETMTGLSEAYNVSPKDVHIEITESAFVNDSESIYQVIDNLKTYGFLIYIDDFGSGYSALNMLKDIDADVVKLDIKFFELNEKNSEKGRNIINSIIQMAQLLDLGLVAEGVETTDQLDILKEEGCDVIQGFFFYRPMNLTDFNNLMDEMDQIKNRGSLEATDFASTCFKESQEKLLSGAYSEALALAERASSRITPETDALLYCNLENVIGVIYSSMCNEMMAVEHFLRGIGVAKQKELFDVAGKLYNNIATEYMRLSDHEHALKYFEMSEREKAKGKQPTELSLFKTNINLCAEYTELGDFEKAEDYLNRAEALLNEPNVSDMHFHYLILQSALWIKEGKLDKVSQGFSALLDETFESQDLSGFWDDMERLGGIAIALEDYPSLKRILDVIETEITDLGEEELELDIMVKNQEMKMAYYAGIDDKENLRKTEQLFVELCKKLSQQTKHERAITIDYKIQLNLEKEAQKESRKQIDYDELTGVGNRYKLEKDYKMLKKNCKEGAKIGVGIVDLDHFRNINDAYGLLRGDNYLMIVSRLVKNIIKGIGGIYRYSGDQFVVLLADADSDKTLKLAKKMDQEIKSQKLGNPAMEEGIQTISQGYILTEPSTNADIWKLLTLADNQLYHVKQDPSLSYLVADTE